MSKKEYYKSSFDKAKDYIIKSGFGYIKIELEADLGREDCDRDEEECYECSGSGYVDCYECEGSGLVNGTDENGKDIEIECDVCDGSGRVECDECCGSGEVSNEGSSWDDDDCKEFILNNVSDEANKALNYSRFYYDGSVDSEFTLTIPVKHSEYLVEYISAFAMLADEIGNGIETGGAGMHICIIPESSKGNYPAQRNSLPYANYNNFSNEVQKLLPALYMLASADDRSRELSYRKPQISDNDKYSAIFAQDRSSLEYRIFETCYFKPEMIKEFIEVIAKTLRFYNNPNLKVKDMGMLFRLQADGHKASRFYTSPAAIKVLRNQLKYLKPEGRKISDLMREREIPNLTELKKLQSAEKVSLRKKYLEHKKRNELVMKQQLTESQERRKRELMNDSYCRYNEKEADETVRGLTVLPSLEEYMNNNGIYREQRNARYTLAV